MTKKAKAGTTITNCTFTNEGSVSPEAAHALAEIARASAEWAITLREAATAIKGADQTALKIAG